MAGAGLGRAWASMGHRSAWNVGRSFVSMIKEARVSYCVYAEGWILEWGDDLNSLGSQEGGMRIGIGIVGWW